MLNIDTLAAVENLTKAKIPKQQAKAIVGVLAEAEGEMFTKKDGELLEAKMAGRSS